MNSNRPKGIVLTEEQTAAMKPGSPAWLRCMSASKIAAVVGLSPWQSRFALWHSMAGTIENDPMNNAQARGHYLEPAIAHWFSDKHPEFNVVKTPTWRHHEREDYTADTDRILECATTGKIKAGLEIKSDAINDEWGPDGSAIIPPYYDAQAQWQMLICGYDVTYFAVLHSRLDFREYVVPFDANAAYRLLQAADQFMDTLPWGKNPTKPDIDAHSATYTAIRKFNPNIDPDEEVELDEDTAEKLWAAKAALVVAEEEFDYHRNVVMDRMGTAKWAKFNGETVAQRKMSGGRSPRPYLYPWPKKPNIEEKEVA